MKIFHRKRRAENGSILMWSVVVVGVMSLVLYAYLNMIGTQHQLTWRSQTWNSCLGVAEAGIEDGMAHLNQNGTGSGNLASQGWTKTTNNTYTVHRDCLGGYYEVTLSTGARPVLISTGYLPAPIQAASGAGPVMAAASGGTTPTTTYISRTVQVKCRAIGRFTKAIVAKNKVNLNGKYIKVDSYHSFDSSKSTFSLLNPTQWGLYDSNKVQAAGDVAVIDGFSDTLSVNDAEVWGKVSTGPDGDIKTNKNAVVGDVAWHNSGKKGVEDGWSSNDANFDMPDVVLPSALNTALAPSSGTIGTNYYDFILYDGDWKVSQLGGDKKGKVYVAGNARLLVDSKIDFSTDDKNDEGIDFAPTGRLELYMKGTDAHLRGKKNKKNQASLQRSFNPDGNTTNFFYYGLPSNKGNIELRGMDQFCGMIYAPQAHISLKAGSLKYYHCNMYGTIIGYDVTMEKNSSLHYDENMANLSSDSFVIESWSEL